MHLYTFLVHHSKNLSAHSAVAIVERLPSTHCEEGLPISESVDSGTTGSPMSSRACQPLETQATRATVNDAKGTKDTHDSLGCQGRGA